MESRGKLWYAWYVNNYLIIAGGKRENKTLASYVRKYPKQGSFLQFSNVAAKL